MSESSNIQDELNKIENAIQAQESLRGILPGEQINNTLTALKERKEVLLEGLEGTGDVAESEGENASGEDDVQIEGSVGSDVVSGDKSTISVGDIEDIRDSRLSIAGEDVIHSETVIVAKDGAQVYVGEQPVEMDAVDRESALGRYLEYVIAHNRYLQLQGIRSGGRLVNIELDQIYISLRATQQHTARDEDEWLSQEASLAPGELQKLHIERSAISETVSVNVEQALETHRHLVILGDPGSGKTTLLRYLALLYARDIAKGESTVSEQLGLDESGYLPVLLPMRQMGAFLQVQRPEYDGIEGHALFLELLFGAFENERISLPVDFFDRFLHEGKAVIMLDGLDEVADPDLRRRVSRLVESFTQAYPECRFIVTSRIVGYSGAARLGGDYVTTTVRDFTLNDVKRFLSNWHRLIAVGQMGSSQSAFDYAADQTQQLMSAIQENERIRELAINPLMLTVIALVHRDRVKLPDRRAELYAEAVDVLLGKWDEARGVQEIAILDDRPFDTGDKRVLLQNLALHMHEHQQKEISAEDVHRLLSEMFAGISPADIGVRKAVERFQRVIQERTGLFVARGESAYAFSHLTIQEYLSALAVADRDDYVEFPLARTADNWWREVILLEAGYLSTQGKKRTTRLIRSIAEHSEEPQPYHNLVLAAECLRDVGSNRVSGNLEQEIQEGLRGELETPAPSGWVNTLRSRLLRGMTTKEITERRVAAANAMAQIGGRRYWHMPHGEPEWVMIPSGEFWIGSESEESFDSERPTHRLYLDPFKIARVPITNAQYALFINATAHKAPHFWEEERPPKGKDSHPVVGVNWYDAMAYCNWLSEMIDEVIALPSEAEWEKAARGDKDKREYPWSDTFESARCNTRELKLGDTTPTGIFQDGASPYGVLDMSGNIWEWTRSLWGKDPFDADFKYPYVPNTEREKLDAPKNVLRVLRGGAFYNDRRVVRCAFRGWLDPVDGRGNFGFRVVVSPS